MLIFGVAIAMLIVLDRLVNATRLGQSDPRGRAGRRHRVTHGRQRQRVIVLTFIVGGLLAGAGGFLYAQVVQRQLQHGLPARVSRRSPRPCSAASATCAVRCSEGCCSGVVEAYGGDLLGASYIDVTAFLVLVLILLFRPSGSARRAAGEGRMSLPNQAARRRGDAARQGRPIWRLTPAYGAD